MKAGAPRLPSRPLPPITRDAVQLAARVARPLRRHLLCGMTACALALPVAAGACPSKGPMLEGRGATALFGNIRFDGGTTAGRHERWAMSPETLEQHADLLQDTDEYGHGVLGQLRDAKGLRLQVSRPGEANHGCPVEVWLPEGQVFETIRPILADVTGDGRPEILTTVSSTSQGARLSIFDHAGQHLAATPFIGQRNRWLAMIGAADLDGDGRVEIALVDRPHLARVLRIFRYEAGRLTEIATLEGVTNHRIGWEEIIGGLRNCGSGPEIIAASGDWSKLLAIRLDEQLTARALAPYSRRALEAAMACR